MKRLAAVSLAIVVASLSPATADTCGLTGRFLQPDVDRDTQAHVNRTVLFDSHAIVFTSMMHVDADGGPTTYSAKDPDGTLCNPKRHPENVGKDPIALGCAMDTICAGANVQIPGGTVLDYRSCPRLLKAFKTIRDSQWKPPSGYKLLPVGIEMKDADKGVPCVDASSTYIVSTSSTPSGLGGVACEQKKWLDTLVPSIVVPKCWANSYRKLAPKECASLPGPGVSPDVDVGDFVALRGRKSKQMTYGVVGDLGPNRKIGEASVGMLMKAAGRANPPTYLAATNGLDGLEQFDVVIFKHTEFPKPLTLASANEMATNAAAVFRDWAGSVQDSDRKLSICGVEAEAK